MATNWNHTNWQKHPLYKTRAEAREAGIDLEEENRIGQNIGLGACLICGDNLLWKEPHRLRIDSETDAFPYCEECADKASLSLKNDAIDDLMTVWLRNARTEEEREKVEKTRAILKTSCRGSDMEITRTYPAEEITRDPIFLLQIRHGKNGSWHTEGVFFTRKEGEDWAAARAYRWPHGWQVYCICAEGQLAEILKAHTVKNETKTTERTIESAGAD